MSAPAPGDLVKLAERAGIVTQWRSNDGQLHNVGAETLTAILHAMNIECANERDVQYSLHTDLTHAHGNSPLAIAWVGEDVTVPQAFLAHGKVRLQLPDGRTETRAVNLTARGASIGTIDVCGYARIEAGSLCISAAIAPHACYTIQDAVGDDLVWGSSAQVYALRHGGEAGAYAYGSGDFRAVAELSAMLAREGADALMLSPSHALFAADSQHFSPYSPSNRCFLNIALAHPLDVFGIERVKAAARHALLDEDGSLERRDLIGWPQTMRTRLALLRALFEDFEAHDLQTGSSLAQRFKTFRQRGGAWLEAHALFEALHGAQFQRDPFKWDFRAWPQAFASPQAAGTKVFAAANEHEIAFHCFAQWLADESLSRAQCVSKNAGMRIGPINDLAIGVSAGGSHAWAARGDFLEALSIGAPPDALAPRGQNWGLSAFAPTALRANGYAPFIATLRAAMRHAGGLRIDHVLGLARLWLTPEGMESAQGAYVRYPLDELLALIALESWRHRCVIIGEDLGTVPDGMREKLAVHGLAGMRVLLFEQDDFRWRAEETYPRGAVAMTTTHDTATLAGFWAGLDLERRAQCAQLPAGQTLEDAQKLRQREREGLSRALSGDNGPRVVPQDSGFKQEIERAVNAAISFIADSAAQMAIIPLEDLMAQEEQPNLPGTTVEHPNWRRRYATDPQTLAAQTDFSARTDILQSARGKRKAQQRSA